jgi:hypothetical protein
MREMSNDLIAPSFLFRYSLPLKRSTVDWPASASLGDQHKLLNFTGLDDARQFADVRAAWHERGLVFSVCVKGKKHPPWCRADRCEESDGFHLWIDTRDTKNIHRASRFCHHFVFLPGGGGNRLGEPVAEQVLINRARENANPVRPGVLRVQSEKRVDGYRLDCYVPDGALTGFDPDDYSRLGLFYAVIDRELGEQTLAYSGDVPFREDPSVWCTVELSR